MLTRFHFMHSSFGVVGTMLLFGVVQCRTERCVADEGRRDAIVKALEHVAGAGKQWIEKRGCVSCHQVTSLLWSHTAAAGYGDAASEATTADWLSWSTQVQNFAKPEAKANVDAHATMDANVDTMARLLLAVPPNVDRPDDQLWRQKFAKHLANMQDEDGAWPACGQLPLQKRPKSETQSATTLWTALALEQEGAEYDRDTALAFADRIENPVSTEWLAARILLADAMGDQALVKQNCEQLLDKQDDDGGWGWLHAEKSDALGTGYALYALKRVGCPDEKAIASATAYLVATQEETGKWRVPGTKRSAKGRTTATANDWGTAWAIVSLATEYENGAPDQL